MASISIIEFPNNFKECLERTCRAVFNEIDIPYTQYMLIKAVKTGTNRHEPVSYFATESCSSLFADINKWTTESGKVKNSLRELPIPEFRKLFNDRHFNHEGYSYRIDQCWFDSLHYLMDQASRSGLVISFRNIHLVVEITSSVSAALLFAKLGCYNVEVQHEKFDFFVPKPLQVDPELLNEYEKYMEDMLAVFKHYYDSDEGSITLREACCFLPMGVNVKYMIGTDLGNWYALLTQIVKMCSPREEAYLIAKDFTLYLSKHLPVVFDPLYQLYEEGVKNGTGQGEGS